MPYWLDRPDREALAIADRAAAAGFHRLWVGEMATFDAFALAAVIGCRNRDLSLTVGPLAMGVRSPVAIALGVASVATLTGASVDVALGASSPRIVADWHGRDWGNNPGRAKEVIEVLRAVFDGQRSDHHGRHVQTRGFTLRQQQPDISIGLAAFGPQMTRVAAQHADQVVLNLVSPAQVAAVRATIDRHAAEVGRDRPHLAVWVTAGVQPGDATRQQLAGQLSVYLRPPGYGEMFTDLGFGELVSRARSGESRATLTRDIPLELGAAIGAIGTEAQVIDRLNAYLDAGADHLGVVPATADDPAGAATLTVIAKHAGLGGHDDTQGT